MNAYSTETFASDEVATKVQDEPEAADAPEPLPTFLNHAEYWGVATPAMDALLERPAILMLGEMWGERDRRNTQDTHWKPVELTWAAWIHGLPADKNSAAWGFSRHPEGKNKEGACVVLGSSVGKARKAKAMDTMYAMGLDIDSGARLDDVLAKVEALNLFCLVYTSFNHGKRGLQLKRDDVMRKLGIKTDPTLDQVKQYLAEHDKHRYDPDFVASITIRDLKLQTSDGVVIALDTEPLDKFRLIFPLAEPVKLLDLAETQQGFLDAWEDKITGLARNTLGVHFDSSCTDPSRLFYTGRHPKGSKDWYCAVVQGSPLVFDAIESMKKSLYTSTRGELNPFLKAAGGIEGDRREPTFMPSGKSLDEWHTKFKERFQLADLLETYCPDRIRVAGGEASGHVHTECPFEGEHTNEGGTATMALNALDSENGYWTWYCKHDSCQGRHKTAFLEEALRQGWFDESLLTDMEAGFILPAEDGEEEDDQPEVIEETTRVSDGLVADARTILRGDQNAEKKVRKIIRKALRDAQSLGLKGLIRDVVTRKDNRLFDVPTFNKMWKEEENNQTEDDRKSEREARRKAGIETVDLASPFRNRSDRIYRIMTKASDSPVIFHHDGLLIDVQINEHGNPRMAEIGKDRFKAHLESRIDFIKDDESKAAPQDEVNNVFHRDRNGYPPLRRVVASPVFGPDMSLVAEPGYHPASGLLYRPREGVVIPPVPECPTAEDVSRAVLDLVDVLADFPFDGLTTRNAVVDAVVSGADVPSFCHALSAGLTPLCRAFIEGPTPGHLARKDKPRTGATKLLSCVSQMAMLDAMARPQSLPDSKAEVQKTLVAMADSGLPFNFFDNLPDSAKVDFGELASAMSAWPRYTGRRLGVTGLVDVTMDATWLFTGNRTQLSSELAERMLLINLDPKMERPGERDGFKYNLDQYIPAYAGRYLHAFLVLVQNWKAKGCNVWTGMPLGGFETHSKIVGGILDAAGINGWLANRMQMQEVGRIDSPEDMLMDALIEAFLATSVPKVPGTLFRVWGDENPPQKTKEGEPAPFAGYRVVSIRGTLMDKGIALAHSGYAKGEDGAVFYPDAAKTALAGRIGAMSGAVREWTAEREEVTERQGRYVFQRAGQDKYGIFYKLEWLSFAVSTPNSSA